MLKNIRMQQMLLEWTINNLFVMKEEKRKPANSSIIYNFVSYSFFFFFFSHSFSKRFHLSSNHRFSVSFICSNPPGGEHEYDYDFFIQQLRKLQRFSWSSASYIITLTNGIHIFLTISADDIPENNKSAKHYFLLSIYTECWYWSYWMSPMWMR